MFNKDSRVAKIWAEAIKRGEKTREDVPDLLNLRIAVDEILEGGESNV